MTLTWALKRIEVLESALKQVSAPFPVSQKEGDRLQEIWRIATEALWGQPSQPDTKGEAK
jgi:hypothetical protein